MFSSFSKKGFAAFFICLLLFSCLTMTACAPKKIQGQFSASLSLTTAENDENADFQYTFYGDGQGVELNKSTGVSVDFSYTAISSVLRITANDRTHEYRYEFEKNDLVVSFQKDGEKISVFLTRGS